MGWDEFRSAMVAVALGWLVIIACIATNDLIGLAIGVVTFPWKCR